MLLSDKRVMPSDSFPPGQIGEIRMSRITVRMPVSVAPGICGRRLALSRSVCSGDRRLRNSRIFQEPGEYPGEGLLDVFAMKKERKAEQETMMTAILHSCCTQNASQTISTLPLASMMPAILTMDTMTITRERQSTKARPTFWRILMRTFHSRAMGKDTTMMSVRISNTMEMVVSRIVK